MPRQSVRKAAAQTLRIAAGRRTTNDHVVTDGGGVPLATSLTGANVPDVTVLLPLVDITGPVGGERGRPRQWSNAFPRHRAFASEPHPHSAACAGAAPIATDWTRSPPTKWSH